MEGAGDIERARWQLKCSLCTDADAARHGAKVQCTKGKCPRAVHVGCALEEGSGWLLDVVTEAEAAELALPHRRRRDPFDDPGLDPQQLDDAVCVRIRHPRNEFHRR